MSEILILTFTGAMVGIDHLCLRTMLSRPVVVAPLLGFFFRGSEIGADGGSLARADVDRQGADG